MASPKRRHLLSGWVRQTQENYTNPCKHLGQNLALNKVLIKCQNLQRVITGTGDQASFVFRDVCWTGSTACLYEKPIAAARTLHKSPRSRFSVAAIIHVSAPTDLCD